MALTLPFIINLFIVQFFVDERRPLLDNVKNVGENIHDKTNFEISKLLLFGVSSNNDASNSSNLKVAIQYILDIKKFDVRLTSCCLVLKDLNFLIHTLTLLPPTVVHARFNDNKMFVFFYYYCRCCSSPVIFCLVLFSIKWFYNQFLNAL